MVRGLTGVAGPGVVAARNDVGHAGDVGPDSRRFPAVDGVEQRLVFGGRASVDDELAVRDQGEVAVGRSRAVALDQTALGEAKEAANAAEYAAEPAAALAAGQGGDQRVDALGYAG